MLSHTQKQTAPNGHFCPKIFQESGSELKFCAVGLCFFLPDQEVISIISYFSILQKPSVAMFEAILPP